MPRELKKPDGSKVDNTFFDEEDNSEVTSKTKSSVNKKSNNKAIIIAAIILIAGGTLAVVSSKSSGNKVPSSSASVVSNQAEVTSQTEVTNNPKDVEVIKDGTRDAVAQLTNIINLTNNWEEIGDATLTIDKINNDIGNKAARYYYYNPYGEESYGYRLKYTANPDGSSTSFGWKTDTEYCYLYTILNYKDNQYLGLEGTNKAIRRTLGTNIKNFDWITLNDSEGLKFNSTMAGKLVSDTNIPVIHALAVDKLNSDGTSNFFLSDSEENESDTGVIKESEDEATFEVDENGISIDSVLTDVQSIVSEREEKQKDDNFVILNTDESEIVSLDDLTVGDIYSLIPDYDTSKVDITYRFDLEKEMETVLADINSYIVDAISSANASDVSASKNEVSYRMNAEAFNTFITGFQNIMQNVESENLILQQASTEASLTDTKMAVYTVTLGKDGIYNTVEHLLKVPTENGVIKLNYKIKLIDKQDVVLELPEKALKFDKISNQTWSMYRDYIEIMSSVAYCETQYDKICNIIKENYQMSIADLIAKIKVISE